MTKVINPCDVERVANVISKTLVDNGILVTHFTMWLVNVGPTRTAYDLTLKNEKDKKKINDQFADDLSKRLFPYEVSVSSVKIHTSQRVRILMEVGSELCDKSE